MKASHIMAPFIKCDIGHCETMVKLIRTVRLVHLTLYKWIIDSIINLWLFYRFHYYPRFFL
jgi:hypothetical protein